MAMTLDVDENLGDGLELQVRFAMVPEWILDAEVSDRAIRLYAVLARFADGSGRAWPGRALLAKRVRCSKDSIDRAMAELVAVGAITKRGRVDAAGDQTSNLYVVRHTPHRPELEVATFRPSTPVDNTLDISTGVAAGMQGGGRTGAATPAAPVRPERKPSELEPPNPQARSARGCPTHRRRPGSNCRACGTTPRQLEAKAKAHRPQWCGTCDERTRLLYDEQASTSTRCKSCNPLAVAQAKAASTQEPRPTHTETDLT